MAAHRTNALETNRAGKEQFLNIAPVGDTLRLWNSTASIFETKSVIVGTICLIGRDNVEGTLVHSASAKNRQRPVPNR